MMTSGIRTDLNILTIREAAHRIRDIAIATPFRPAFDLSARLDASVFLKLENMQNIGSFKIRRAANAILKAREWVSFQRRLTPEGRAQVDHERREVL